MRNEEEFSAVTVAIIVALLLLGGSSASATTWYVSASGNDLNTGRSPADPWRTIAKVNMLDLTPGDSVLFKGGETFSGGMLLDGSDGNDAARPVTIASYGNGRAVIDAGNGPGVYAYNTQGIRLQDLVVTGSGMLTNGSNGVEFYADLPGDVQLRAVRLENLEVCNFGRVGVRVGAWKGNTGFNGLALERVTVHDNRWDGIQIYGFFSTAGYPNANVSVRHCASYNNPGIPDPNSIRGNGIVVSNTDGAVVEYCTAHDNGSDNIHCGGPGGIWTYDCSNIVIQHCESYRNHSGRSCDGLGFDLDGGTRNSVLQYNYSHDNDGGGFLMGQMANGRPWKNNVCRYNISVNDARTNAGAITLFKEQTATVFDSVVVYNNTVVLSPSASNPAASAFRITEWYTGIEHAVVHNNLFVTTGGATLVDVPAGYAAVFAGNLYWSSGATFTISYQGRTFHSLADWRRATGNETLSGTDTGIDADPLLDYAGGAPTMDPRPAAMLPAYMLLPGSPARAAGLDLASRYGIDPGGRDFWGHQLPGNGPPDIGAWQSLPATSVAVPTRRSTALHLHPNPVRRGSSLMLDAQEGDAAIVVADAIGRTLHRCRAEGGRATISLQGYMPGTYFVRVTAVSGAWLRTETVIVY